MLLSTGLSITIASDICSCCLLHCENVIDEERSTIITISINFEAQSASVGNGDEGFAFSVGETVGDKDVGDSVVSPGVSIVRDDVDIVGDKVILVGLEVDSEGDSVSVVDESVLTVDDEVVCDGYGVSVVVVGEAVSIAVGY